MHDYGCTQAVAPMARAGRKPRVTTHSCHIAHPCAHHASMRIHVHIHVSMRIHVHIRASMRTHVHIHAWVRIHVHIHASVHIYARIKAEQQLRMRCVNSLLVIDRCRWRALARAQK
eukprot:366558-Chlamydomonas_euryale.AAC.19